MCPPRSQTRARLGTLLLPTAQRGHKVDFWHPNWPSNQLHLVSPTHPHRQGREEAVPVGVHCGVSPSFPSPWEVIGQHHRIPQERPGHPLRPTSLGHHARLGPVRVPPVPAQGDWRQRWENAGRHQAKRPAPSSTRARRIRRRGGPGEDSATSRTVLSS
jgi:hypothetical protein